MSYIGDTAALTPVMSLDSWSNVTASDTTNSPLYFDSTPPWWKDDFHGDPTTGNSTLGSTSPGEKRDFDTQLTGSEDICDEGASPSSAKKQKTQKLFSSADLEFRKILDGLKETCEKLKAEGQSTSSLLDFTALDNHLTRLSNFIDRTDMGPKLLTTGKTAATSFKLDAKDGRSCTTCSASGRVCMSSEAYLTRWEQKSIDGVLTYVPRPVTGNERRVPACETCRTRKAKCKIDIEAVTQDTSSNTT